MRTPTRGVAPAPTTSCVLVAAAQDAQRLLALVARGAVEDQDAVEVVHLVLDHARLEPGRLDRDRLAAARPRADAHVDRALDVHRHAGQAEAALLGDLLVL